MAGLRLVSVNIERSKHLERVEVFLRDTNPDIVCMQEVVERDIDRLTAVAGTCIGFAPSGRHPADSQDGAAPVQGNAIFTRLPIVQRSVQYYGGSEDAARTGEPRRITNNYGVVSCDVDVAGVLYRFATLHFVWTPDGSVSDEQRESFDALTPILNELGPLVLCGDFNAPRGGEIFSRFASRFTDNIPAEYTSSIDGALHRAGPLPLMVDGLFSTLEYEMSDVRLQDGVSDHCAIVAHVTRR